MSRFQQSARSHGAGLAAFAILSVLFYWKLILTDQYTWVESPDLAHQVLPWLQYQAGEWHSGHLPLWAPFEWGGQPLIGQGQASVVYPPNWLLYLAPLKRGWLRFDVLHFYYLAIHIFAGWFMFLLCRDLGSSFAASVGGGMIFSFGGYVGTIDWPQMVNGAIWGPLIFLFHLRAVRGFRPVTNGAWSGFFLGVAWLSGHHQIPIFLTLTLGASCAWFLYRRQMPLRAALATATVFPLVGAWQLLPGLEYGRLAKRWVGLDDPVGWKDAVPYFLHHRWSFQPVSIFGIVFPGFQVNTSAFIGVGAVSLAWLAWRDRVYFAVIAGASLLYSLAHFGLIEGWFYSLVPMVEKARSASMAVAVFGLAAGPMVAAGLDRLGESVPRALRITLWGGAAAILAFYFVRIATGDIAGIPEQRPVMTAIAALTAAALLGWRDPRARLGFLALMFVELSWMSGYYLPNRFDPGPALYTRPMAQNQDIVDRLRDVADFPRIMVDDAAIPFNFGDWHGVDVYGGYLASLTTNLLDAGLHTPSMTRLMGVTHWVGREPKDAAPDLVYAGAKGINLYAAPDPLPRTWTVHSVFRADTPEQARALIENPAFDFRQGAILSRDLPLERCRGDRTALLRRDSNRVVVTAEMACKGILVLNDVAFPGWKVSVDGKTAELLTANVVHRGVALDAGWHTVEFLYRPFSVILGGILTLLGTLLAIAASIMRA